MNWQNTVKKFIADKERTAIMGIGNVRGVTRQVKRWRNDRMAVGFLEAAKHFH